MPTRSSVRTIAAASLAAPAFLCAGILVILWRAPRPSPATLLVELGAVAGLAAILAVVLLSQVAFPRPRRLILLLVCAAAAVASYVFAPVTVVSWPLPLWLVYRFYRSADL